MSFKKAFNPLLMRLKRAFLSLKKAFTSYFEASLLANSSKHGWPCIIFSYFIKFSS